MHTPNTHAVRKFARQAAAHIVPTQADCGLTPKRQLALAALAGGDATPAAMHALGMGKAILAALCATGMICIHGTGAETVYTITPAGLAAITPETASALAS